MKSIKIKIRDNSEQFMEKLDDSGTRKFAWGIIIVCTSYLLVRFIVSFL